MSTGYLAAFATLISWTISTLILARLSRLEGTYVLNKAALFFSIFLLGIQVCILDGLNPVELFSIPTASNWLWLGISGILGKSIGDYFGYAALRILGARRRSMITTLSPGFTWFFGLLILNESMNWLGLLAMIFTLSALILFINSQEEKEEVKRENFGLPLHGFLFGIGASALTGLAFILSKMTIIETENPLSAFHATWIRVITAFAALMLFDIVRNKHQDFIRPFLLDRQKGVLLFFGLVFAVLLGLSFSLMAITKINAAVAYTIFALLPVSIILVSVVFYKKRISLQSWVYSILAVGGVLVLVWRESLIKYFL